MALHFSLGEYAARRADTCRRLECKGLAGLLMFRQESMYYLTGYDTQGYVTFQGMYMTADGNLALLTRSPDRLQAAMTSVVEDVRIWKDEAGAEPAIDLRPGNTVGDLFNAHAKVFDTAGYTHCYLNACGYTMNANYQPSWMDSPMIFDGNPQVLAPGMVFFTHMILLDKRTGLSMSLGETALLTEQGCESVTHAPRELRIN